jgi:cytochrome c oxidase assembly protein subunit 11
MSARSANRTLVLKLVVVAIGMFGFGFALAPMYSKLCELTGLNNLQTRHADRSQPYHHRAIRCEPAQ